MTSDDQSTPSSLSTPNHPAGKDRQAGVREWLGLAVLALGALLMSIDVSVAILALPLISETLGAVADRVGRRRMVLMGAGLFGLASIAAAFSISPLMLIGARSVMWIGAAALSPSFVGLLTGMFRNDRQRSAAFGIFMACFMGGMILGPVVGGVLLTWFWWGSVFLLGVPVMLLLVVLCPILVDEYRGLRPTSRGMSGRRTGSAPCYRSWRFSPWSTGSRSSPGSVSTGPQC